MKKLMANRSEYTQTKVKHDHDHIIRSSNRQTNKDHLHTKYESRSDAVSGGFSDHKTNLHTA
jgi:hypothetical protein